MDRGLGDPGHPIGHRGARLLEHIPRMEHIAGMIRKQQTRDSAANFDKTSSPAQLGAEILRLCMDLDRLTTQGLPMTVALTWMRSQEGAYEKVMLDALDQLAGEESAEAPAAAASA